MMKITYQKSNGEIFDRIRNTYFSYRVGDTTSIGWKVLAIEYKYKDRYYDKAEYDDLVNKRYNTDKRIFALKKKVNYIYKNVNHFLAFLVLFKSLEMMIARVI